MKKGNAIIGIHRNVFFSYNLQLPTQLFLVFGQLLVFIDKSKHAFEGLQLMSAQQYTFTYIQHQYSRPLCMFDELLIFKANKEISV